jgi:enamine deaminase RidA (YjgF/YER057c/UK114 family)
MTIAELKAAILADAQAKAFADAGNDSATASRINSITPGPLRPIKSDELLFWAGQGAVNPGTKCRLERIREAASGATQNATPVIRGAALVLTQLVMRDDVPLDPRNATHLAMINTLVTASVLTAQDRTDLQAIAATVETVTPVMVAAAWAEFRPNGRIE